MSVPSSIRHWTILLALVASGCTTPVAHSRYPSLLPRAAETRSDAEPLAEAVVAAPDPTTDTALATLRKTLAETQATFSATATTAERSATAAKGDAVGGERWIAAQAALADLDALRATTSSVLTEIDDRAIARAAAGMPLYPAMETLRGEAQAASEAQSARIDAIQASLPAA